MKQEDKLWVERHKWLDAAELETQVQQGRDEGRDLTALEGEIARLRAEQDAVAREEPAQRQAHRAAVLALSDAIEEAPLDPAQAAKEPSDWESLSALIDAESVIEEDAGNLEDRIGGALHGRIAGCLLGKPCEGWRQAEIRAWAEVTGDSELTDYWRVPMAEERKGLRDDHPLQNAGKRERIAPMMRDGLVRMVEDDDINYTVVGWYILDHYGADFAIADVGETWVSRLPLLHTCTAERVAYRNLAMGMEPPATATWRNPYREYIGAQIRGDFFGWAALGRPGQAAAWAYRDAALSHTANGIYGEMWVAALLALAPFARDWETALRESLRFVPGESRLAIELKQVLQAHEAGDDGEKVLAGIHSRWEETTEYGWCHTISNAAVVAASMLAGENDFSRTISLAVRSGFDTDCNGATCGSLLGLRNGRASIPARWVTPLQDRMATGVRGFAEMEIEALAEKMVATITRLRA